MANRQLDPLAPDRWFPVRGTTIARAGAGRDRRAARRERDGTRGGGERRRTGEGGGGGEVFIGKDGENFGRVGKRYFGGRLRAKASEPLFLVRTKTRSHEEAAHRAFKGCGLLGVVQRSHHGAFDFFEVYDDYRVIASVASSEFDECGQPMQERRRRQWIAWCEIG